ncbi:hypothetical protein MMC32_003277 [Xylographa parallela]|nr:hypothetical protein [Xylographa parallela]
MGVDTHRPLLPAPTESSTLQNSHEDVTATDFATDLSHRTDHTSYSIPDDGSPITITTTTGNSNKNKERGNILARTSHQSQTSLLIEYFEGGKGPNVHSRPSVRVKVTPSSARKPKDTKDHIQITEAGGHRKPSYTRRISLGPRGTGELRGVDSDERSISSYTSAAEDSSLAGRQPPVEIEVLHKDQGSDLSTANRLGEHVYMAQNGSDISSMPADSMVEGNVANTGPRRNRSRSLARDQVTATNDTLKTPSRRRSRSLSRERITKKVIEKLGNKSPNAISHRHKHGSKSRSRSVSKEQVLETVQSPKRRSSRHHNVEELPSAAESSLLTTSQVSDKRRSGDQYSFRSGTSKSSINNPKLLETVEDAIRRLILPELTALKIEQKTQHNRSKFDNERRDSMASAGSSQSREEITRRVSKHASAPDFSGKPKVVLNRDSQNPGTILSGNSLKGRKDRKREKEYESPSERSFDRGMSEETVIRDGENVSRRRSKGLRDVAAGALVGGILTHAALKHHDSKSSIDRRERRKRRSKSHSRSESLAESTEEIFQRHDVPPMPMRSEITDSDLTRDSILSERTSTPTSDRRRAEIRYVARGSPREIISPASRTPTRSPGVLRNFETYHEDGTSDAIDYHTSHRGIDRSEEIHHGKNLNAALAGAATATAGVLTAEHMLKHHDSNKERSYAHGRGLSPIQSVATDREESEPPNRDSFRHTRSSDSLSSAEHGHERENADSIKSLSSIPSTDFARARRPKGISLETGDEILEPHEEEDTDIEQEKQQAMDAWYEQQHEENERYRDSLGNDSFRDSKIDIKHLTNYTDDSMDTPYLDKVTAAQHIRGIGANAEYIHTPIAVESAVASLHDSSVLDVRSTQSGVSRREEQSYLDSPNDDDVEHAEQLIRNHRDIRNGSPLKNEYRGSSNHHESTPLSEKSYNRTAAESLAREATRSVTDITDPDEPVKMTASGIPLADSPLPEIGHGLDSKSDFSTNPSIIQGPLGGVPIENRTHWPYQPTPPQSKGDLHLRSNNTSAHESLKAAAANFLSAAAGAGVLAANLQKERKVNESERDITRDLQGSQNITRDGYQNETEHDYSLRDPYLNDQAIPTPLTANLVKDEGYVSAANPRSAGALTPDYRKKGVGLFDDDGMGSVDELIGGEDPFVSKSHMRHLSGNSHGMASPLYDNATGRGMDRIQSKDVVALMDHLTVRDAQRNARDTEILVTLVRSAAEMRNSFEDMKRFIAEQDEMLIDVGDKQHERTAQKIIGGPRPQPLGTPRIPRRSSADDDTIDEPSKRRSVFRRALKGLGGRSSNDLARIEDMLVHLLGEVEELKAGKDLRPSPGGVQRNSYNSYENMRDVAPEGYEPEGQAGTSSTGNQSGYFSNPPSRQANRQRGLDGVRGSQNRVSTVLEGDEEPETLIEAHEQKVLDNQFENNEQLLTPTRDIPRGGSVPLGTPPAIHIPTGTQSNENTPKTSTDKSRKHKSSSSSFFPKISRWSKTTASTIADNVRGSGRQERPFSQISRSGSDLNYNIDDHYDPQGDDRIRSNDSVDQDRPPSPLIPSQVSEKPPYEAHRDSLNLQHPQPRPGPTARYQNHLESQAQTLNSPISPSSDQFGSNPILARYAPGGGHRLSGGAGNLSPISDAGFSEVSQRSGPPRPPKVRDDGPLVPQRPPKVSTQEDKPTFAERSAAAAELPHGHEQANGSPRSASGQRKPTGPRPIAMSGSWSPDKSAQVKQNRYRGSPNHIASSEEDFTF